ncbi:TIR domain-containing protein [Actinoplanes sp. NPDC051859]|uniref:TIR domain-containing protein n=1 Tax=Actinoplanes sp. NPDC051859 TaxID=3363909 RepID=UPI0037B922D7
MSYDAFISYSHAADGALAPAVQRGLQRLARPWHRRRALEVFRDQTGLGVSPALWTSIRTALDGSRYFVLMACPEAAESPWVNQEIEHWLARNPVDRLLPVVTSGGWVWDAARNDFDGDRSTAVPPALRGVFQEEPRHLDLRWARSENELDLRHTRFRDAVAELAATMHGMSKEDLDSEDVARHRRMVRMRRGVLTVVGMLLVLAGATGSLAMRNAREAATSATEAARQQQLAEQQRGAASVSAAEAHRQRQIAATEQQRAQEAAAEARKRQGEAAKAAADTRAQRLIADQQEARANRAATDAEGQRSLAAGEQRKATQAGAEARKQREAADQQQARADGAMAEAERQRSLAAEEQRKAKEAAAEARKQRESADQQQARADGATAEAERQRSLAAEEQRKAKEAAAEARKQEQAAAAQQRIAMGRRLIGQADAARQNDPRTAVMLSLAALQVYPGAQAEAGLVGILAATRYRDTIPSNPGDAEENRSRVATFSADGRLLAVGSTRMVQLWDLSGGPVSLGLITNPVDDESFEDAARSIDPEDLALSGDATLLAAGSGDGTVGLFDISNPQHPRFLSKLFDNRADLLFGATRIRVALSADGHTLASAFHGSTMVYDLTDRERPRLVSRVTDGDLGTYDMALSADGRTMVTSSEWGTKVWDLTDRGNPSPVAQLSSLQGLPARVSLSADGNLLAVAQKPSFLALVDLRDRSNPQVAAQIQHGNAEVHQLALSADGRTLAANFRDQTLQVWDVTQVSEPLHLAEFKVDYERVRSIGISADGRTLALNDSSDDLQLWDISGRSSPRQVARVADHPSAVAEVAISAGGRILVVAGDGGEAQVWDLSPSAGPRLLGRPELPEDVELTSVALSADGRTVAIGMADSVWLWDTADLSGAGTVVATSNDHSVMEAVAFGNDGRLLAVADSEGIVDLWDTSDRQAPRRQSRFRGNRGGWLNDGQAMSLSADGQTLAINDGSQTALWDLTRPAEPRMTSMFDNVLDYNGRVVLSADGRTLVTADHTGLVQVWDTADRHSPRRIAQFVGDPDSWWSLALSPDGRTIASDGPGGAIQLWDLTDRSDPRRLVRIDGKAAGRSPIVFSPDGNSLVALTGTNGMSVGVWDLAPLNDLRTHALARACAITGGGPSQGDWARYVPDLPYEKACQPK